MNLPTPSPTPVQLDPVLRAQIQVRTLAAAVESLTNELTYAHMQGAELEKKLAASLAENETLRREKK